MLICEKEKGWLRGCAPHPTSENNVFRDFLYFASVLSLQRKVSTFYYTILCLRLSRHCADISGFGGTASFFSPSLYKLHKPCEKVYRFVVICAFLLQYGEKYATILVIALCAESAGKGVGTCSSNTRSVHPCF